MFQPYQMLAKSVLIKLEKSRAIQVSICPPSKHPFSPRAAARYTKTPCEGQWASQRWGYRLSRNFPTYPWNIARPPINSLCKKSFHSGFGDAWGMLQGYVGALFEFVIWKAQEWMSSRINLGEYSHISTIYILYINISYILWHILPLTAGSDNLSFLPVLHLLFGSHLGLRAVTSWPQQHSLGWAISTQKLSIRNCLVLSETLPNAAPQVLSSIELAVSSSTVDGSASGAGGFPQVSNVNKQQATGHPDWSRRCH